MKHLPLLAILSLFIPLVGLIVIYYLKDTLENENKTVAALLTYQSFIVILIILLTIKINPNV